MEDPQFRTGDGCQLRIWTDTAKNEFASNLHGRPIFDECIFVEVIAPGSQGSAPVFEVERTYADVVSLPPYRSDHYARYIDQIEAFKQNTTSVALSGTPLSEWPQVSRTMAASLKASGIFTVEALADLSDSRLTVVGPDGRTWRTKAQTWLASAKDSSVATALAAELELTKQGRARSDALAADLSARLEAAERALAALQTPSEGAAPSPAGQTARAAPTGRKPAAPAVPPISALAPAPESDDTVPAPNRMPDLV
jgi:hypothetical protein